MDETVFASYREALSCWEEQQEENQHLFTFTGREEEEGSQEQVSRVWVGDCLTDLEELHCGAVCMSLYMHK